MIGRVPRITIDHSINSGFQPSAEGLPFSLFPTLRFAFPPFEGGEGGMSAPSKGEHRGSPLHGKQLNNSTPEGHNYYSDYFATFFVFHLLAFVHPNKQSGYRADRYYGKAMGLLRQLPRYPTQRMKRMKTRTLIAKNYKRTTQNKKTTKIHIIFLPN